MRASTLALLVCLAAPAAGADWLVMRDGTRVETRGAWSERGRLIVFTSSSGQLASLRADSVDLAASRQATAEAAEAAAQPAPEAGGEAPPPRREARRITNADIPAGRPAPATAAAAEGDGEAEPPAATSADLQVRDTAQQVDPIDGHLVVTGTLANVSQRTAAVVELIVQAIGADGALLGTQPAALGAAALTPGATTGFEARFPEVYGGALALRFAPSASFLETLRQDPSRPSASEDGGGLDGGVDDGAGRP